MLSESAERRKKYLQRKKGSLCPRCGSKIKKTSKFIYCDDCREYYRNYNREISETQKEQRRERYAELKEKKCCPRCGKFMGKKSVNILCTACLNKQYKYNYGKNRKKSK